MDTQGEFLEPERQILQEMDSSNRNLMKELEKSMEGIVQTTMEAEAVNRRCQQLVTDLAKARQEEQMLLDAIDQLSELENGSTTKFHG